MTGTIEQQYLDLMADILKRGTRQEDRTGVGTLSLFGAMLRHDMSEGVLPALTTKRVYWKTAVREMLWFLTGGTNIRPLVLQGVKIWNEWPHAIYVRETGDDIEVGEFARRIAEDEEFALLWGDLGPVYGKQWVDWPTYVPLGDGRYERGPGIDQVAAVIKSLRENPGGRRHIIEGWNVAELDRMALPPCHKSYQFAVRDGRLDCLLYQRSCDVFLGLPFNLIGQAVLTAMIAQQVELVPGELIWSGGDVHVYSNHVDQVHQQLARTPRALPSLKLNNRSAMSEYRIEDFVVDGYHPHDPIAAPVAV